MLLAVVADTPPVIVILLSKALLDSPVCTSIDPEIPLVSLVDVCTDPDDTPFADASSNDPESVSLPFPDISFAEPPF